MLARSRFSFATPAATIRMSYSSAWGYAMINLCPARVMSPENAGKPIYIYVYAALEIKASF